MSRSRIPSLTLLAGLLAVLLSASPGMATLYSYQATVVTVGPGSGYTVGTTFGGTLSWDPAGPVTNPNPFGNGNATEYGPGTIEIVGLGSLDGTYGDVGNIRVVDDNSGQDQFLMEIFGSPNSAFVELSGGTALWSTQSLLEVSGILAPVDQFGVAQLRVMDANPFIGDMVAQITSLVRFKPVITGVTDVPNDQGRQVRVEWSGAGCDSVGGECVEYAVYRQIDPGLSATAGTRTLLSSPSGAASLHASWMQAAGWDFLTTVPARAEDSYAVVVPTLADSTPAGGAYESTFLVSALTTTLGVFYDSVPGSGYSLDNLAPGVPQGFAAVFGQGAVSLGWDPAPEADFQYHRVYRSTDPGFTPGPATLVHETVSTQWDDTPAEPWAVYYKVTTLDVAGNESLPASSGAVVATPDGPGRPEVTALLGAHPNPLRSGTRIGFTLRGDEPVSLQVFDVTGRLVRSLVSESLPAGRHEVRWDGTDESGAPAAPGVYLYRLLAGDVRETQRMVLLH